MTAAYWEGFDRRQAQKRTLGAGSGYLAGGLPQHRGGALSAPGSTAHQRAQAALVSLREQLAARPWFWGAGLAGNDAEGWQVRVMVSSLGPDVLRHIPAAISGVDVVAVVVGARGGMVAQASRQPERRRHVCSCGQQLGLQPRSAPLTVWASGCDDCRTRLASAPPLGFPGMWGAILGRELRPHALGRAGDTLGKWKAPVDLQKEMRQAVLQAWAQVAPDITPTLGAVVAIQSIGYHESDYGRGWGGQGKGSNNMGAYQCKCKPDGEVCCDGCFLYQDSRPTAQGQVKYMWCYKKYATPADGFADIIKLFKNNMKGVWRVLQCGNLDEVAWQMRKAGYFEGFTTDKREAARAYAKALDVCAKNIAEALGETQAAARMGEGYEGNNGCPTGTSPGPDGPGTDEGSGSTADFFIDELLPAGIGLAAAGFLVWQFAPELVRGLWR